jgi:hypothetical protein
MREAINGRQWAVQFVAERLDGKVPQPVEQSGSIEFGPTQVMLQYLRAMGQGRFEGEEIDVEPDSSD